MPNVTKTLAPVAEYLREHGWIQGGAQVECSEVCLGIAVALVLPPDPSNPEDASEYERAMIALAKRVLDLRPAFELSLAAAVRAVIVWNDQQGRTFREVECALRSTEYTIDEPDARQQLVFDGVDYRPEVR
jgi:hypothetical protein